MSYEAVFEQNWLVKAGSHCYSSMPLISFTPLVVDHPSPTKHILNANKKLGVNLSVWSDWSVEAQD